MREMEGNIMKKYNLLTEDDLIPNNHYEVISLFGKDPNPRSEVAFYDRYGYWSGIADNHTILEIIDNSVMLVLAKENFERYKEIISGGSYDDGKYNNKRCSSSYEDCEELYPVSKEREDVMEL